MRITLENIRDELYGSRDVYVKPVGCPVKEGDNTYSNWVTYTKTYPNEPTEWRTQTRECLIEDLAFRLLPTMVRAGVIQPKYCVSTILND